ncbi:MAG: ATP-binding protein [Candidatus Electrothrix sp. AR3]|nr:ATP-binding protein [Candidatus Electrothrix sp. AR3]
MKMNFNDLYAYDVSEGALFVLFVLVLLSHPESPDFFALDNVDNALNPGLVKNLMAHLADIIEDNNNKQVLLTTHNPTTLDAIDLFNENHRLFVVSRANDGQTVIKRIAPPKGMDKSGWEDKYFGLKLSEIWLSGAIGGLPTGFK